jgi:hypothetical protein
LFVTELGPGSNSLYHNEGNSNHWINIQLIGTVSNASALGAKIRLKATIGQKTFWQLREISSRGGSGNAIEAHFGLGDSTNIDQIRIDWPSGIVQELTNETADQYKIITEPSRWTAGASGVPQLTLHGGRELTYEIQSSDDLLEWSFLSTITTTNIDGSALILSDPKSPDGPQRRFYRALLRP